MCNSGCNGSRMVVSHQIFKFINRVIKKKKLNFKKWYNSLKQILLYSKLGSESILS